MTFSNNSRGTSSIWSFIPLMRLEKLKTNWIKFTHKYWQKLADLVLYQKIERAITNNPTIQLDVNKDGDNLNLASETAEYQSPNENFQVAFYDQITQFKMAILADSALIQFNRKQTKNLFCFLNVHCIKLLLQLRKLNCIINVIIIKTFESWHPTVLTDGKPL